MSDNQFREKPCSLCDDCRLCEAVSYQSDEDRITAVVRETVVRVIDQFTGAVDPGFDLPVGVSARHLHVTQRDLEVLYGSGHQLRNMRSLQGPGEFAAEETVTLVGPNMRALQGVRILGPCRTMTQVELSSTDGVYLGIALPLRASGDVDGSAPITIIGPNGGLNLAHGAIRADRHLHIDPRLASQFGVEEGQYVQVDVPGPASLTFNHVRIRVNDGFDPPAMHIDTDDGNAAGLKCGDIVRAVVK